VLSSERRCVEIRSSMLISNHWRKHEFQVSRTDCEIRRHLCTSETTLVRGVANIQGAQASTEIVQLLDLAFQRLVRGVAKMQAVESSAEIVQLALQPRSLLLKRVAVSTVDVMHTGYFAHERPLRGLDNIPGDTVPLDELRLLMRHAIVFGTLALARLFASLLPAARGGGGGADERIATVVVTLALARFFASLLPAARGGGGADDRIVRIVGGRGEMTRVRA
jgi:hypothetical protein